MYLMAKKFIIKPNFFLNFLVFSYHWGASSINVTTATVTVEPPLNHHHHQNHFKPSHIKFLKPQLNATATWGPMDLKFKHGIGSTWDFLKSIIKKYPWQIGLLAITSLYNLFLFLLIKSVLLFVKLNIFRDSVKNIGPTLNQLIRSVLHACSKEYRFTQEHKKQLGDWEDPNNYQKWRNFLNNREHVKLMFKDILPVIVKILFVNFTPELLMKDLGGIIENNMQPFIETLESLQEQFIEPDSNKTEYYHNLVLFCFTTDKNNQETNRYLNSLIQSPSAHDFQKILNQLKESKLFSFLKNIDLKNTESLYQIRDSFQKLTINTLRNIFKDKTKSNELPSANLLESIFLPFLSKQVERFLYIDQDIIKQTMPLPSSGSSGSSNPLQSIKNAFFKDLKLWIAINQKIEADEISKNKAIKFINEKKTNLKLSQYDETAQFYLKKIIFDEGNKNQKQFLKQLKAELNLTDDEINKKTFTDDFIKNLQNIIKEDKTKDDFFNNFRKEFLEINHTRVMNLLIPSAAQSINDTIAKVKEVKSHLCYGMGKEGLVDPKDPTKSLASLTNQERKQLEEEVLNNNILLNFIFDGKKTETLIQENIWQKIYNSVIHGDSLFQSFLFFNRPDPSNDNNPSFLQQYVATWQVLMNNNDIIWTTLIYLFWFINLYIANYFVKKFLFNESMKRELQSEVKKILLKQDYGYNTNKSAAELLNSTKVIDNLMEIILFNTMKLPSILGFVGAVIAIAVSSIKKAIRDKKDPFEYLQRNAKPQEEISMMDEISSYYDGVQYEAFCFTVVILVSMGFLLVKIYRTIVESIDLFKISFNAMKEYDIKLNNFMNNLKAIKSYGIEEYKYHQLLQMENNFINKMDVAKSTFSKKINIYLFNTVLVCFAAIFVLLGGFGFYLKKRFAKILNIMQGEPTKMSSGLIVALKLDIMLSKLFLLIIVWACMLKSYLDVLYKYVFLFFSTENILDEINLVLSNRIKRPVGPFTSNIKIKNLTNVTKTGETILNNITMDIVNPSQDNKGQIVLLLGASGSGKTTLANHIAHLQNNQDNTIFLESSNGPQKTWVDVNQINGIQLRENLVYQDQNPMIFDDSLRNNISLGHGFNDKQIFLILRMVRLEVLLTRGLDGQEMEAFESLSYKIDQQINLEKKVKYTDLEQKVWFKISKKLHSQLINSGSNLSGGQRQRIALARLLIKYSTEKIILMDEATTGLDSENIHLIMNSYLNVFMNPHWNRFPRTMILVTHDIQFILIIIKFCLRHRIPLNFKYLAQGTLVEDVFLKDIYSNNKNVWDLLKNDIQGSLLEQIKAG